MGNFNVETLDVEPTSALHQQFPATEIYRTVDKSHLLPTHLVLIISLHHRGGNGLGYRIVVLYLIRQKQFDVLASLIVTSGHGQSLDAVAHYLVGREKGFHHVIHTTVGVHAVALQIGFPLHHGQSLARHIISFGTISPHSVHHIVILLEQGIVDGRRIPVTIERLIHGKLRYGGCQQQVRTLLHRSIVFLPVGCRHLDILVPIAQRRVISQSLVCRFDSFLPFSDIQIETAGKSLGRLTSEMVFRRVAVCLIGNQGQAFFQILADSVVCIFHRHTLVMPEHFFFRFRHVSHSHIGSGKRRIIMLRKHIHQHKMIVGPA